MPTTKQNNAAAPSSLTSDSEPRSSSIAAPHGFFDFTGRGSRKPRPGACERGSSKNGGPNAEFFAAGTEVSLAHEQRVGMVGVPESIAALLQRLNDIQDSLGEALIQRIPYLIEFDTQNAR
jgi:hypothetical protein